MNLFAQEELIAYLCLFVFDGNMCFKITRIGLAFSLILRKEKKNNTIDQGNESIEYMQCYSFKFFIFSDFYLLYSRTNISNFIRPC